MKRTLIALVCLLCYLHVLGQSTTFMDHETLKKNELRQRVEEKHNIELASVEELQAPFYVVTEKTTMRPAIVDEQNEFVVPFGKYDAIRIFKFGFRNRGLCMLYRKDSDRVSIYNLKEGKVIGTFDGASAHDEGYFIVKDKTGMGVIDLAGIPVHPLIYDNVEIGKNSSFYLTKGDTLFLKDKNRTINYITKVVKLRINHSGTQLFNGKKWGIADKELNLTTPFIYDSLLYFYNGGLFMAKQNGNFGLIDVNNNKIVPVEFRHVGEFSHCQQSYLTGILEGKVILYNKEGKQIIDFPITETEFKTSQYLTFRKVMVNKMSAKFPCEKKR